MHVWPVAPEGLDKCPADPAESMLLSSHALDDIMGMPHVREERSSAERDTQAQTQTQTDTQTQTRAQTQTQTQTLTQTQTQTETEKDIQTRR